MYFSCLIVNAWFPYLKLARAVVNAKYGVKIFRNFHEKAT